MLKTLLVSSFLFASTIHAVDREKFLDAIKEVETGGRLGAVGRNGERGPWQISATVWRQHSRESFWRAHNYAASRAVARQHFDWIEQQMQRAGVMPTPGLMAVAWNAGLSSVIRGRWSQSTDEYATRVANLYGVL